MKKGILLGILWLAGGWMLAQAQLIKSIGSQRQLFTDRWFVDSLLGCRMVKHEPVDRGAVLY
ncbi:MAG: hypothetical protein ACOVSS_12145, partial [Bacteroidia bacterium]